jgi:hypothetical protein
MSNKNKSNNKNNSNSIVKMRGGAAPPPDYNEVNPPDNILDKDLFQIINKKINDIVEDLKKRLGANIPVTNTNAKQIMEMLNNFSQEINNNVNQIILDNNKNIKIGYDNGKNFAYTNEDVYYAKFTKDTVKQQLQNIITIDTPGAQKFANTDDKPEISLKTTGNMNILNNRLRNCQNLEMLYLIKHDELMTTFAFALNLFDKYKYAIKIVLFLLKNLVYKTGKPGDDVTVKLPDEIIKDIGLLVRDQGKVKGVIEKMKTTLIDTPENEISPKGYLEKLTTKLPTSPPPQENNLNRKITNNTIPA